MSADQNWVDGANGQLLIAQCTNCARWAHPPAASCPECAGTLIAQPVSGLGTVFTHTVNFHPYNPTIPTPYVIAIIELVEQEGLRLAANIVGCEPESVTCGMSVEVRFEQRGDDAAFVPVFTPRHPSVTSP